MEQSYDPIFEEEPILYANFGLRLGAAITDFLILAIPFVIVRHLTGDSDRDPSNSLFKISYNFNYVSTYINCLIGLAYHSLLTASNMQGSLGKRLWRIRITDMNGSRLTLLNAAIRHLGKFLSTLLLFVGFFMMLWDKNNQTLHDRMAGSIVVV